MSMSESLSAPEAACESSASGHPLELIPVFRRWPRSFLRDVIYTGIWNTLFAIAFTGLALVFDVRVPMMQLFRMNFVFAQCIGYPVHGMFLVGDRLFPGIRHRSILVRMIYYAAVPILGVIAGYVLGTLIIGLPEFRGWMLTARGIASVVALSLVITAILLMIFLPRERAARIEAAMAREQARLAASERETTEARIKLLEAQVEPHFLYNTMAHVVSLIDTDPATAKGMLERLIALLRRPRPPPETAAARCRRRSTTCARTSTCSPCGWDRGLPGRSTSPPDWRRSPLPPMLLQPVVENAIKHGLEPKVDGGNVAVSARRDAGRLVLTIADTGMGFPRAAQHRFDGSRPRQPARPSGGALRRRGDADHRGQRAGRRARHDCAAAPRRHMSR